MAETDILMGVTQQRSGVPLARREAARIPIVAFGISLGLFFGLTYIACVLFDLWFPGQCTRPGKPSCPGSSG
jgi:hypothetical protein